MMIITVLMALHTRIYGNNTWLHKDTESSINGTKDQESVGYEAVKPTSWKDTFRKI